jgi:hypothetical protein
MSNPCGGIDGCWHTGQVAVGYYPYVVIIDEVEVRVAPNSESPVVFAMKKRQRFGVQSRRNPNELATPPMRPARSGFRWGYGNEDGASGWVPADAIRPDSDDQVWADGPAGADFQVGAQLPPTGRKPSSCRGDPSDRLRVIKVADTYLRYGPQSTPYYYLLGGDRVRERWRGRGNYMCVQVVESSAAPVGARGWIPYASVE